MTLPLIAEFIAKSGLRKILSGIYIFTALSYLLKLGVLPADHYVQLATIIILALFGGNVAEHFMANKARKESPEPIRLEPPKHV